MPESTEILVVTSCTSLKAVSSGKPVAAEKLYVGEQHRRLMRGVIRIRSASTDLQIDLKILSAGYGLVDSEQLLSAYDSSFSDMAGTEIEDKAKQLGIPRDVSQILAKPYALELLLLGDNYTRAAGIDAQTLFGGPAIAFGSNHLARRLEANRSVKVVAAGTDQARRFSCGVVGLKGELGGRLLERLAGQPDLIHELASPGFDVLGLLDETAHPTLPLAA